MPDLLRKLDRIPMVRLFGRVARIQGLKIEIEGLGPALSIGGIVTIEEGGGAPGLAAEIVGFEATRAIALPMGPVDGVRLGARAFLLSASQDVLPSPAWLGRVVNAMGEPIDGKGPILEGDEPRPVRTPPLPAHARARVGPRIDLGVRALNTFATCCDGQRMGIFAGSGVGKSVLLSMMARYTQADISVVGLIGERGREVQEFIEDDLGAEGLSRSVVVVATSDEAALLRRRAAYLTLALAEYFRDHGQRVLCLIDSVTRFAMAQREIGLACGEPPTTKGYTPTVFAELPRLLERAGPGLKGSGGSITGLFTVLVDGDDHNEPIADAVRGILDGHIVMERAIAERGRYPAINVLKSISRTMPDCNGPEEQEAIRAAREAMATFDDMAELIRLGAYTPGAEERVDQAIAYQPHFDAFLSQGKNERSDIATGHAQLGEILAAHRTG